MAIESSRADGVYGDFRSGVRGRIPLTSSWWVAMAVSRGVEQAVESLLTFVEQQIAIGHEDVASCAEVLDGGALPAVIWAVWLFVLR